MFKPSQFRSCSSKEGEKRHKGFANRYIFLTEASIVIEAKKSKIIFLADHVKGLGSLDMFDVINKCNDANVKTY